jgi:hypothetical protein
MSEAYEAFVKQMEETFPKMFSNPYGGFAVGQGWWPILEKLCNNIQSHTDWREKQGKDCPQVVVEQIKEKFGGLRFYYQGGDEYIHGMVTMAESIADITCESCGNPGKRRGGGWIHTYCDPCEIKREEARKQYARANGLEE